MTGRRSDENGEAPCGLVQQNGEVEERDLGLETGECQGVQKMNFDYSDSAEQK